jgi:hypothetical protein
MNKAQYVIELTEMMNETSLKKAAAVGAGGSVAAYGVAKGLKAAGKAIKGAIEGSDTGGVMGKIKKGHELAKDFK